jgi:tRNA1(Val) A37 N6-methylase TrmN6
MGPHDETGFLGCRVLLRQPRKGHRAGTDAALVVAAARPYLGQRVLDIGAGTGAIGLSLAVLVPQIEVVLVEIDPTLAALARQNAGLNGCGSRVSTFCDDIRHIAPDFRARQAVGAPFDLVVMNPPFRQERATQPSPNPARKRAHVMREGELPLWIGAASVLLRRKGALVLISEVTQLGTILSTLAGAFGSVALRPVHPRADAPASRILVYAMKGARGPLSVAPALVLHQPGGAFTARAEAVHCGEEELPF